jgi:hypothetical protein
MKIFLSLLFSLTCLSALSDCPIDSISFPGQDICAEIVWEQGPTLNDVVEYKDPDLRRYSSFKLYFWIKGDLSKEYILLDFTVRAMTFMQMDNGLPSHGIPAPLSININSKFYESQKAEFFVHDSPMCSLSDPGGKWYVHVRLFNTIPGSKKLIPVSIGKSQEIKF